MSRAPRLQPSETLQQILSGSFSYDSGLVEDDKDKEKYNDIIAATINGDVVELSHVLKKDTALEVITSTDRIGSKIYRNGLKYLYITAIKELFGKNTIINFIKFDFLK